jgi:hypothetical protein
MKIKDWSSLSISDQGRVVLLGLLGLLGLLSILLPSVMIGLIGTLVGLFAIFQSGFFILDIFIRNKTKQTIPSQLLLRASIYGIIGVILMILPTEAMRSILGYLMIIGLLFYAFYQWSLTKKYVIKKQAWAHYVWMVLSIGLSLFVAFNLNAVTTLLIILLGVLGMFYSLTNVYPLLIQK